MPQAYFPQQLRGLALGADASDYQKAQQRFFVGNNNINSTMGSGGSYTLTNVPVSASNTYNAQTLLNG